MRTPGRPGPPGASRARSGGRIGTAAIGAWLLLGSCARLPDIPSGECGNRVIEASEDCDGLPSADGLLECREPGSVGACHWDCSRRGDGNLPSCPAGWGCDLDGICRRPTGEFEPLRELEVGGATTLLAGDFDGDGRSEVASLEPFEGLGITRLRLHYFDERAALAETRPFPPRIVAPVFGDLSGDGLGDLLFSDGRVGVLRGRSDRGWVPETFSSYRIPDSRVRTISVFPSPVQGGTAFLVFARFEGVDGIYVVDGSDAGVPRRIGPMPSAIEDFAGDPVAGRVFEDVASYPCEQVVVGARGRSEFSLIDSCTRSPETGEVTWRPETEERTIALEPAQPIDAAPLIADMNGDGHQDVLIGAAGRSYVSYGDGQTLAPAIPYALVPANLEGPVPVLPMPLAVADVTGDGAPDFVFDNQLVLSSPALSGAGFDYGTYASHEPGYWSTAKIVDLNGNGHLDIVAASSAHPGVDFFNGTGAVNLLSFSIPTNRPVGHLVVGDFDGDLITDLGMTQISAGASSADSLWLSFGALSGAPLPPTPVAQLPGIEQVSTILELGIHHIVLCASEMVEDQQHGSLALLASNGDRIPMASYELTSFATDGSTDSSAPVRLAAGGFSEAGQGDVIALGYKRGNVAFMVAESGLEFWLLPALTSSSAIPVRLQTDLRVDVDGELLSLPEGATNVSLDVRAGNFDDDPREEVVFALLAGEDEHCALFLAQVEGQRLEIRQRWDTEESCRRVELLPVDADADGALDLALLAGPADLSAGSLSVFWNDGSGGFDAERRTLLTSDAPSAFSPLPGTPARPFSFAFVNAHGVHLVPAAQQPREFDPPSLFVERADATGVVAADLNGDTATDLVYAAGGNLHVWKASLDTR